MAKCSECKFFGTVCPTIDPEGPVYECYDWKPKEAPDVKTTAESTDISEDDHVNHPSLSIMRGIECIEAIKASMSPWGFQDYCKVNVFKYIWRWRDKGGLEDLQKAQVYLWWLIESVEKEEKTNADLD